MEPITIGSKGTASVKVDETNLALTVGSGSLPVFATPMMAALMEEAACNAIAPFLSEGETTVGTKLDISHDQQRGGSDCYCNRRDHPASAAERSHTT